MKNEDKVKSTAAIMNSKEFKNLVDGAMNDVNVMEKNLIDAGMNPADARLKIQQIYFRNLKTFSEPETAAISILAELKTRIDLDRVINPEQDLVSDKYVNLLDQMRKTIDLVRKTKDKKIVHEVQKLDDGSMNFKFIDIEE